MDYQIEEDILYIFTDGASRPVFNHKIKKKTGRYGGMGIWFVYYDENFNRIEEDKSNYISYTHGTNQDMELCASLEALKYLIDSDLSNFKKVIIITDSMFLCDNRMSAVYGYWDKPGVSRRTKFGDPVIHKKDRKKLAKYRKEIKRVHSKKVEFERVKGHQKNNLDDERVQYNNKADKSAVKGAFSSKRVLQNNVSLRAPFFKNSKRNKASYLPLGGCRLYIHIHNSRYIRKKRFRYNYEVVSWDSPYYTQTAWVHYAKSTLSARYIYLVKIKNDGSNQIEEIISKHTKDEIKQKMIKNGVDISVLYGKLSN